MASTSNTMRVLQTSIPIANVPVPLGISRQTNEARADNALRICGLLREIRSAVNSFRETATDIQANSSGSLSTELIIEQVNSKLENSARLAQQLAEEGEAAEDTKMFFDDLREAAPNLLSSLESLNRAYSLLALDSGRKVANPLASGLPHTLDHGKSRSAELNYCQICYRNTRVVAILAERFVTELGFLPVD